MHTSEVYWTQELQWAINDIVDGVPRARITRHKRATGNPTLKTKERPSCC
jgi:hypothetical protein